MSWIKTLPHDEAEGLLKQLYDAAVRRAGHVFGIVQVMSLNPPVLRSSMDLYRAVMFGDSALSRAQRELLAVVVSKTNGCHY
jgi:alkylhydroperoxidase family enzyme